VRDHFEFPGIDLKKFQVIEDSFGIQDDPAHAWGVTEASLQGLHAPAQVSNVLMQFGEFGGL
jgi:hypothetical protein